MARSTLYSKKRARGKGHNGLRCGLVDGELIDVRQVAYIRI